MPRARPFRTHAMARLWEELRYAPPATLARLAANAEEFCARVDPLGSYAERLVEEQITRYTPDAPRDGDVLAGDALRADLAAFVESATVRAPVLRTAKGGALTLKEAAAALGVTVTTLRRYRQRGLMMHHVVGVRGGAAELCVLGDCLRAFQDANGALLTRAARTGRLDPEARARLAAAARERLAEGAISVNRLASQLAATTGRSSRTVRRHLLAAAGEGGAGVSAARSSPTRGDAAARAAARAWHAGMSPQQMAARRKQSVASCIRAVQRGRHLELREAIRPLTLFVLPTFSRADAAATLLAPPAVRRGLPAGEWPLPAPKLGSGSGGGTAAVIAHHFLLWRAAQAARGTRRPGTPELDAAERDLRWAYRLRRAVVQAALPDALARVAQHLGSPWKRLPQELQVRWAAAAARAMAQALEFRHLASVAIDDVHPLRAAALAVERLLARADLEDVIARTPPRLDASTIAPWIAHLESGDRWVAALPALSAQHCAVIARRFGLDGAPPATVDELAPLVRGSASVAQGRLYAAMASASASAC